MINSYHFYLHTELKTSYSLTSSTSISASVSSAPTSFLSDITLIPTPIVSQGDLNLKEHFQLKYYLYMSIYVCIYVCIYVYIIHFLK